VPGLALGGWANPHADAATQAGFVADAHFTGEYFLTQIVSHHDRAALDRFQNALALKNVTLPGIYGVFYYRSANRKTLSTLQKFLSVPLEELTAEFVHGASPEEVCARTIKALRTAGVKHCYVSNLPAGRARQTLARILELAGEEVGSSR
jgi:hypothetical protein